MAGQMRDSDPGQYEKTGIVRYPWQALSPHHFRPADVLISGLGLPSGSTKEQASQMASVTIPDYIVHVLPHCSLKAQIMVGCQIVMAELLFRRT